MNIASILRPERITLEISASSKKRALERLSDMLASAVPQITKTAIFDALNSRERLGSTALGQGVAIPHGRMAGIEQAVGAILKLQDGVDYDAPDNRPVDLMFALLVPEDCTDEHLELLSELATMFADERELAELRAAGAPDTILALFTKRASSHAA